MCKIYTVNAPKNISKMKCLIDICFGVISRQFSSSNGNENLNFFIRNENDAKDCKIVV